jgi:hypothetical protein
MPLPSSGAISMESVRAELGFGTPIDMNNLSVRTLLQARYGGAVSLGNGYGRALSFSFGYNQFAGAFTTAPSSVSQTMNIRQFFSTGQLATGGRFRVTADLHPSTAWRYSSPFTWDLFVGSARTPTESTPFVFRKQNYMRLYYGGGDTLYAERFYSGDSTDSKQGGVSIIGIQLVL